jgi:hypothetical protein
LWDWYGTKTIRFDADIEFCSDEDAKTQDCYRRFEDVKKAGIRELELELKVIQRQLEALNKLTIKVVKP